MFRSKNECHVSRLPIPVERLTLLTLILLSKWIQASTSFDILLFITNLTSFRHNEILTFCWYKPINIRKIKYTETIALRKKKRCQSNYLNQTGYMISEVLECKTKRNFECKLRLVTLCFVWVSERERERKKEWTFKYLNRYFKLKCPLTDF